MANDFYLIINYLVLFFLFIIIYGALSFFFYYRRKLDSDSVMTIVILSITFVLVKFILEITLSTVTISPDFSVVIYLIDTFVLIIISDFLEVPQMYLRRISCIFVAVILTLIAYNLVVFLNVFELFLV